MLEQQSISGGTAEKQKSLYPARGTGFYREYWLLGLFAIDFRII
jgi:hypothetical protein